MQLCSGHLETHMHLPPQAPKTNTWNHFFSLAVGKQQSLSLSSQGPSRTKRVASRADMALVDSSRFARCLTGP